MNLANLFKLSPFISWDFLMVIALFLVFVILGFFWQKKRMLVLILALYLSRLFLTLFPLPKFLEGFKTNNFTSELFLFWGMFVILFLVFAASGISLKASSERINKRKKPRHLALKGMFYGFFGAGMFISLSLTLMSPSFQEGLSLLVSYLFVHQITKIAWLLLPLVAMIFFK